MKRASFDFRSPLGDSIERFLAYKRSLHRHFDTEELALRLLDRYLTDTGITRVSEITAELSQAFLDSRLHCAAG